jgi:hypothetical protein
MWRLIKLLFWLAILAAIALVAYAYLGPILLPDHFTPPVTQITAPVELELD